MAATFVLMLEDGAIGSYYTLSATGVKLSELPERTAKRLPRYPLVPATLLGRLAVDRRRQGHGCGRFLLADAFYEREGFLPFPDRPMKLFRPLADIRKLFD